ncbi:MAG: ABC transporter permease [Candidatus Omnitrophica bacterium]|nr:ABC transporter permease [Candidatus Omnitrophota bacterium]
MRNLFNTNRWAMISLWVLGLLYAAALFADILAPYSIRDEARDYSYCPPSAVHVMYGGKFAGPFVYGTRLTFNEYHARIYIEDRGVRYPVRFWIKAEPYRFLGILSSDRHVFGVEAPGRVYLFGADSRGRDVFSRIIHGGRVSLTIGLLGVIISFTIGLLVGGAAGYFGGRVDQVLMRVCEMVMMVPGFYLLLALRAAVPDTFNSMQVYCSIVVILSFIGWAGLARIIRGMCLSLREREYVLAARTMGLSHAMIIRRHILPHTVSYSLAAAMLSIPGYILSESALSLIGLGIQDPYASWGNMLSEAMNIVRIQFAPWILTPAFFIFLTVMCFNILGDALRDALDPTTETAITPEAMPVVEDSSRGGVAA